MIPGHRSPSSSPSSQAALAERRAKILAKRETLRTELDNRVWPEVGSTLTYKPREGNATYPKRIPQHLRNDMVFCRIANVMEFSVHRYSFV